MKIIFFKLSIDQVSLIFFIVRFIFIVELGIVLIILIDYIYYRYRHGFSYIYELDKGE